MCGICGIYNLDNKLIDPSILLKMTNLVKHRGPDDEGYLLVNTHNKNIQNFHGSDTVQSIKTSTQHIQTDFKANLGFGHRRLSIIDLSADGHQPMSSGDKRFWIIFNGEIYNYLELKTELKNLGHQFTTNSDTEVILSAYRQWGELCVTHFNGMFAFSIWDHLKHKLYCARDRMGIKPFYYFWDNRQLIWASEIKQMIKSNVVIPDPNYHSIFNYLLLSRQDIDKSTLFENIVQLPPGHTLVVEDDNLKIRRYWNLEENMSTVYSNDQEYASVFLDLLRNSVRMRMRSDVPLGIALSGGLDSSSIAVLAKDLTKNRVKTFSVYYEDNIQYDEREYIQAVLKAGDFEPVYFTSNGNVHFDDIQKWIYHQDEPPLSASPFSAYNNYRNIKKADITVALNGQGGDEILAGYHTYFKYYLLSLIQQGKLVNFIKEFFSYTNVHHKDLAFRLNLLFKLFLRTFLADPTMKKLEKYEMSTKSIYSKDLLRYENRIVLPQKFSNSLNQNLYETVTHTMVPHLLHWEDRNSMAFSVESRVPMLDHHLVDYMFSIPINQKIREGETKFILRQAMEGILPELVRTRKDKIGFATPTDLWIKGKLHTQIGDIFQSSSFKQRGIFRPELIYKIFTSNPGQFKSNEIWRLFSIELWFRLFVDK